MTEDERFQQVKDEIGWHTSLGDLLFWLVVFAVIPILVHFSSS